MSRLLTVARLLTLLVLLNFLSGTFLVVCGFTHWDITASVTAFILSACIVNIEAINKWNCIGKESFTTTLIICVLLGGASAFFWFFHIIYKTGHYQGDYLDMLWSLPTKLVAFVTSVYLILRAHSLYTQLTLESLEAGAVDEDATPLSRANFSTTSILAINSNNVKDNSSPV